MLRTGDTGRFASLAFRPASPLIFKDKNNPQLRMNSVLRSHFFYS